jgi:hypothetical protein
MNECNVGRKKTEPHLMEYILLCLWIIQKTNCLLSIEHKNKEQYQTLQCPTNAHNIKHVELLKHFKIKEAAPTCFSLQRNHHQGANSQYLAKFTRLVQCGYIEVVQTSVLWLHSMTSEACVLCTV